MPRPRDPKRDEAFELWKKSNGEKKLREIAAELDIPEKTVSGWKSKDGWTDKLNGVLPKSVRSTPNKKSSKRKKQERETEFPEPVIQNEELTDKQKEFCLYYLKYFNATKAYQKAYGCQYNSAAVEGHRLLRNPNVVEEINRIKAERQKSLFLDSNAVLQKYMDIAFADITDFTQFGTEQVTRFRPVGRDDEGNPIYEPYEVEHNYMNFKQDFEVDGTLITEVKMGKDGVSVKLADKMKALEMLAKFTDMLDDMTQARLKEEQMRMNILKTKKEIDHVGKGDSERPINIVIGRKGGR